MAGRGNAHRGTRNNGRHGNRPRNTNHPNRTNNESFRTISSYPVADDFRRAYNNNLPMILTDRPYTNVESYLDTQFRVFREDFIGPLRECVFSIRDRSYKGQRQYRRRVYQGVRLLFQHCIDGQVVHRLKFDTEEHDSDSWSGSRIFDLHSLLCLSVDNFTSVSFATVANSHPKTLAMGLLDITFTQASEDCTPFYGDVTFQMFESPAYFEAYRGTLNALKSMGKPTLPFSEYIVDCSTDATFPPYLKDTDQYDLSTVLDVAHDNNDVHFVSVSDQNTWPEEQQTVLNHSQLDALRYSLSSKLSIIQGPPGTGKTYLGLRIARTLLLNQHTWRSYGESPLHIVSYTNHALDRFLEELHNLGYHDMVRIGMRCTNQVLNRYLLKNVIRRSAKRIPAIRKLMSAKREKRALLTMHAMEVKVTSGSWKEIRRDDKNGFLVPLCTLAPFMKPATLQCFLNAEQHCNLLQVPVFDVWLDLLPFGMDRLEEMQIVPEEVAADEIGGLENMCSRLRNFPQTFVDSNGEVFTAYSEDERCEAISYNLHEIPPFIGRDAERVEDPFQLALEERWGLYLYWKNQLRYKILQELKQHERNCAKYKKEIQKIDREITEIVMTSTSVVGMTTTGAANKHHLLEAVKPKIIIVEEAAQVPEPQLLASLTAGTQHLILLGDHEQLRPSCAYSKLQRKPYKLDVSLFERMIKNRIPAKVLNVQYRMRPEIADNIRFIYPELEDDESVRRYEDISGVPKNVYFIDHKSPQAENDLLVSKYNEYEATCIREICLHLVQTNGYNPAKIIVLTMYKAQIQKIKGLMGRQPLSEIRVRSVDAFQGEENDIVLLSLVRSNQNGQIGFLQERNRLCVSLSRAKKGLFVVGNFDLLQQANEAWRQVVATVRNGQRIGTIHQFFA